MILSGEALDGYQGEFSGVWGQNDSPIHIVGTVILPEGDTLFIEPGVEVRFDPESRLFTGGVLLAEGTEDDSITFTSSLDEPEPGSWRSLTFRGRLRYSIIEFAQRGVFLKSGRIDQSTIRNSMEGVTFQGGHHGVGTVSHCLIEEIHSDEEWAGSGIYFATYGVLEYSIVVNCDIGISTSDYGYLYRNVFAFNETELMVGWDFGVYGRGNIFYHTNIDNWVCLGRPFLEYNCFFETEYPEWCVGEPVQRNINGTECDEDFNIFEDPLFIDPDELDFGLQEDSPCIDAGDIEWQRDPDGSIADIGPYYYHQDDPGLQNILMKQGWNLISLNIVPAEWYREDDEGASFYRMCEDQLLVDDEWKLVIARDENGNFSAPYWDYWRIDYWNLFEGYQFKINDDREVTWMGTPIDAQADLSGLDEGWNFMAYYPRYDLPCEFIEDDHENNFYVINTIIDNVIIAKNVNGHFCMPGWDYSRMDDWTAGQGYKIYLREDIEVFNYPAELVEQAAMPDHKVKSLGESHWIRPASTGANMSVLVTNVNGVEVNDGDQIAAFNTNGDLVGTGMFTDGKCGLGVWGDNKSTTETVEGLIQGEAFELKLWDADRQVVVDLRAGVIEAGSGLEYTKDGIVVLDVKVDEPMPTEFSLAQNYPNPFNSKTRMAYEVPELSSVSIRVFDLTGRHVTTLISGEHQTGRYTAVWEARDITSGIYIVQMTAANFNSVAKVMLVK
ncbi:MAG: T9SS type A sorting domain-containing protein [Calditrichaeota bacterium]|nr:T9SS type A sorting domain-containing protein [Calditrichota bacterium]